MVFHIIAAALLLVQAPRAYAGNEAEADTSDNCNRYIRGLVYDSATHEPLAYAAVFIPSLQKGTYSNEQGAYELDGLCPGNYTVVCHHLGCPQQEKNVTLSRRVTQLDFAVPHSTLHQEEVVVQGEKREEAASMAVSRLTGQQLAQSRGKLLGEALKTLPGVSSLQTGANISKPVIHGLHSNRVLILNNGIRQEGQQWGSEHAPEVDPFIASEMKVIKGPAALRYGPDAIGGVILVEPAPLRLLPGLGGELNLAGFSNNRQGAASAMLEGAFTKLPGFGWRVQGSLKQGGNVRTPNYYLKNTGSREQNFSLAAGYKKSKYGMEAYYSQFNTKIGIFSGAHIGNLTDLYRAMNSSEPIVSSGFSYDISRPYQEVSHELIKAKAYLQTGPHSTLELIYARQYNLRNEYDKDPPRNDSLAALKLPELHYEITTHSVNIDWAHTQSSALRGRIGVTGLTQANTYEGRFFIPNFKEHGAGVYVTENLLLGRLELEGGLRYDYRWLQSFYYKDRTLQSPIREFKGMTGNAGATYRLHHTWLLRLNSGTAWRPPAVNELYSNGLHHGAAAIEIGDEALEPERSWNTTLSISHEANKMLSMEAEIYYNRIDGFIYLTPQLPPTLTIRGAFPTFVFRQVDASLKGVDLDVQLKLLPQLVLKSKAGLLRAWNHTANDHLILMPADRFDNSLQYNFKDKGIISDAYIQASVLHVQQQVRLQEGQDYAPAPAGYTLLGMEAGMSLKIKKQQVNIGLGVGNLLDTPYRDYLDRFRYFTDAMGRNVSLRISIPFNFNPEKSNTDAEIIETPAKQ